MAEAARKTVAASPGVRTGGTNGLARGDAAIIPGQVSAAVAHMAAKRMLAVMRAKDELLIFTQLMMPDPNRPDDPDFSRYEIEHFHKLIAEALEKVEKGEILRLIITAPPRHGKSQLASRSFGAWYIGRNPYNSMILASYNEELATDVGNDIRTMMATPMYAQIFPTCHLRKGSKAVDRQQTLEGGLMIFTGANGTITGRGGDIVLIDDPVKNSEAVDSPTFREKQWRWFTMDIMSRMMSDMGAVIIIMCMVGETPVLMGDGTEKPLKDVRPGDVVATYDNGVIKTAKVKNWANQGPDFCYEIRTTSGTTVKANERHPFLVCRDGVTEWVKLKDLKVGDKMLRTAIGAAPFASLKGVSKPCPAKGTVSHTTIKLAGQAAIARRQLAEGLAARLGYAIDMVSTWQSMKGCWQSSMASAPSVISRPEKMFVPIGAENFASITATKHKRSAVFSAMTAIWQSAMEKLKQSCFPQQNTYVVTQDEIEAITPCGLECVYDIEVEGTENFIANGLVSHNTRWHEDDLVGRLTDPKNPCYSVEEAKQWQILHLTGLAEAHDNLGRQRDEALWEKRHSARRLKSMRSLNPRGFNANYQGRPTAEDGEFFKRDWLKTYRTLDELPPNLRMYGASDHAVGLKQENDPSCLMMVGVDERDHIWVMPDLFWQRAGTEVTVERMIDMMDLHKPLVWWGEDDHIMKSIGPFLFKRMQERQVYCNVEKVSAGKIDKGNRAQAIRGRMSMGMVHYPAFAPWWANAMDELLKFPRGRHDDFVDPLAHIGRMLGRLQKGSALAPARQKEPMSGTFAWIKWAAAEGKQLKANEDALGGM